MDIRVSTQTVIEYGVGQVWVPGPLVYDESGCKFLIVNSCRDFAKFCGLKSVLKDNNVTFADSRGNYFKGNSIKELLRQIRKDAYDEQLLLVVRERNNDQTIGLPKKRDLQQQKVTLPRTVVDVLLPEVACQGILCAKRYTKMVVSQDQREGIAVRCDPDTLQWLQVAAQACAPDVEREDVGHKKRRHEYKRSHIEVPEKYKGRISFRPVYSKAILKYFNEDGHLKYKTLSLHSMDTEGLEIALAAYEESLELGSVDAAEESEHDGDEVAGAADRIDVDDEQLDAEACAERNSPQENADE